MIQNPQYFRKYKLVAYKLDFVRLIDSHHSDFSVRSTFDEIFYINSGFVKVMVPKISISQFHFSHSRAMKEQNSSKSATN